VPGEFDVENNEDLEPFTDIQERDCLPIHFE